MRDGKTQASKAIIVRSGRERPLYDLHQGDRIAFRDYDPDRKCYVFHVVTEAPCSPEVMKAERGNDDGKGSE